MRMVKYYYMHTCVYTYIHFHWKEHDHANERQMISVPTTLSPRLPRSYDVGTTSMPFLLRWYYVNPVLTTLLIGSYHILWRLRSYYVNFENVQNETTSLRGA